VILLESPIVIEVGGNAEAHALSGEFRQFGNP
jgi:hypothetical protein